MIKPQAELAPNTTYELFEHHPSLPCFSGSGTPCRASMATTFATFTTGALPDTTPPQFDGLKVVSLPTSHTVCNNSACCGPYIVHQLSLQWNLGSDDRTSPYLAYNVYRDGQLFIPLAPGVDWAGNEDGNSRVQTVANLCRVIAAPADGGTDASIRSDVRPVNDSSVAQHDGAGRDVAPSDGSESPMPQSADCGCRVGRARSDIPALGLVMVAVFLLLLKRRGICVT